MRKLSYNNALEMFPTNIMAGFMELKPGELFEAPQNDRVNVDVSSLLKR